MTAQETTDILNAVPIGSDRAQGWGRIYDGIKLGAPSTFRAKLHDVYRHGLISRRAESIPGGTRFLYWREPVGDGVPRDLLMAG